MRGRSPSSPLAQQMRDGMASFSRTPSSTIITLSPLSDPPRRARHAACECCASYLVHVERYAAQLDTEFIVVAAEHRVFRPAPKANDRSSGAFPGHAYTAGIHHGDLPIAAHHRNVRVSTGHDGRREAL